MITSTTSKLLKLTSPSTTSSYYLKDRKQVWDYDPLDKTSPQSDTVLIGYGGKRFKLAGGLEVVPEPIIYQNTAQQYTAKCGAGTTGADITIIIAAGRYQSSISIEDANSKALSAAKAEAESKLICVTAPTDTDIIIDLNKYGIKADGITDNGPALTNMAANFQNKQELIQIPNPGTIVWDNNTWHQGIKKFELKGGEFKKIGAVKLFLNTAGLFNYNLRENEFGTDNPTFLFGAGIKGSLTINPGAAIAKNFAIGDRVYVDGYECQGQGFPKNPRFFEWKIIKSVDYTSGLITFTEPLEHDYNPLWKDYTFPDWPNRKSGKPRITKVSAQYPEQVKITDTKITRTDAGRNFFCVPSKELICENVQFNIGVWPTNHKLARFINCTIDDLEIDKDIDTIEFINCNLRSPHCATGVKNMRMINCRVSQYTVITPQRLYAEGTTFGYAPGGNGAVYDFVAWSGSWEWAFKNCIFPTGVKPVANSLYEFTVMDYLPGKIILPGAPNWDSPNHLPQKLIFQGSNIWSKDGTAKAIVGDIIEENGNHVLLLENISGNIAKGQNWNYYQTNKRTDLGGNELSDGTPISIK